MKLTKKLIDDAEYQGSTYANGTNARMVMWDTEVPGFGCRLLPSGKKVFILSYRAAGRKRQMTLGTYGVVTLDQARKLARSHLAQVETAGADPLAEREQEAQGETVSDLCDAYLVRFAKPQKKTWPDDERRINKHILPKWGRLKARAVTTWDVATLHNAIGLKEGHPYEANRTVELISAIYNKAKLWGFVPRDFSNPAEGIDAFKEQKRDRWITAQELPHLARAINEEPNEVARHALWLYLLTGVRKTELLAARWEWIDWDRAELRLPDTKADRVHYVPLSGPAIALLRSMPRDTDNPYILPGRGPRGMSPEEQQQNPSHLINIQKPWDRVRTQATIARWREDERTAALIDQLIALRAKQNHPNTPKAHIGTVTLAEIRAAADFPLPPAIDDVRLHDLRRTVGSWLAQAGNSLHLIGRVLNHSNVSTTQVYARFGEDSVRSALEQHGARIMGAAGIATGADIIDIKEAKKARA